MLRCALLLVLLVGFGHCLVSFPNAEVLQAPDIAGTGTAIFTCQTQCQIYVDKPYNNLVITQNGNLLFNFIQIIGANQNTLAGMILKAGKYSLENRGEKNPEFVFYKVESTAANYASPVFTLTEQKAIAIKGYRDRFVTILSSMEALEFSSFTGVFPAGYPRIYATGYDSAGDGQCRPVYQARSQFNAEHSWPVIPTALLTVDFGFEGDHTVSVSYHKAADPTKAAGMTVVYTSPGYIGCTFNSGQNYHSTLNGVSDVYTLQADRLDIDATYSVVTAAEPVQFTVNNEKNNFVGTDTYSKHLDKGTFDVSLSWVRQTSGARFAIQMDFGSASDPPVSTSTMPSTTSVGSLLSVIPGLVFVIAALVWL